METSQVAGHTLIVPDRGRSSNNGNNGSGGSNTNNNNSNNKIVKIEYTIKNDAGRVVRFQMQPSGKSYTLRGG